MSLAISPPMDCTEPKTESSVTVARSSIQPQNRTEITLSGGNTSDLYFSLHPKPNSFINGANTYLSFTYTVNHTPSSATAPAGAAPVISIANGSGSSFIRTLEVQAGSTSLELVTGYNVVAAMMDDFNSADRHRTMGSILTDRCQTHVKHGRARGRAEWGQERRICVPLLSGIVGTLADKYLPVDRDLGLSVRLTLEDPNICLVTNTADGTIGYSLKDLTLETEYVTVDPAIYAGLVSESKNIFKVTGTGISAFSNSVSSGSTSQSLLIPARYNSVRSFFTTVRKQQMLGSNARLWNSVGARSRDNINSYVYRVGGMNTPMLPVSVDAFTGAEVFSEISKAWSAHASVDFNCCFSADQFVDNAEGDIATAPADVLKQRQSSFLMAVSFDESGFSASQTSGINTIGGNVFLDLTYEKPCQATIIDTFCLYDSCIEINHAKGTVKVVR